jgi:NTE family protein
MIVTSAAIAVALSSLPCHGLETEARPETGAGHGRPGLVLVLSGGGARGAAHVGVLEVLEELQVPVDMIVGTSMGAVIGGLYAAGYSPDELRTVMSEIDWGGVFTDSIPHLEKSFRRKQDDVEYLVRGRIHFRDGRPYVPLGVLQGLRIELVLKSLELAGARSSDFDRLPIPFRAVAADLATSDPVVLGSGSLARAIRASMSIPGAFAPVEIDGRLLVDGGVAANLPVGIAIGLGADRIIAVDISTPLDPAEPVESLFGVIDRMSAFLTVGNLEDDLALLRVQDLLVRPELGDFSFADFVNMPRAVEIGREAALAKAAELRRFTVDDASWQAYLERQRRPGGEPPIIDRIEIRNAGRVDTSIIRSRLRAAEGAPLDVQQLADDIMALHGLETFGQIEFDVVERAGERLLTLDVEPVPYGRHSVRFGLGLEDDFDGQDSYGLAVRHRVLPLNRRGGELVNVVQIGNTQALVTELYQPLDKGLGWFVSPAAGLRRENWPLWFEGDVITELWLESVGAQLDVGREFSSWGEVRLGGFWFDRQVSVRTGFPNLVAFEGIDSGVQLRFRVLTHDEVVFPRSGSSLDLAVAQSLEVFGSEVEFTEAKLEVDHAWTLGRTTLVPALELYGSWGDNRSLFAYSGLGGLLRLSGYGDGELLGQRVALARLVSYHELFSLLMGALETRVFVGASVEAGNAWLEDESITSSSVRWSGGLLVGADTVVGPVYLGYGRGEYGRHRVYLNIGSRF